jgi:hypothetical protein
VRIFFHGQAFGRRRTLISLIQKEKASFVSVNQHPQKELS